jgi:predicted nucleic acid-binding Zn ribbon protein
MSNDLNSILNTVAKNLGMEQKAREFAVLQLWQLVVPEAYRACSKAKAVVYRGNKAPWLRVNVSSGAMATELSFEREELLEALNKYSPQTQIVLAGIDLKVGKV